MITIVAIVVVVVTNVIAFTTPISIRFAMIFGDWVDAKIEKWQRNT